MKKILLAGLLALCASALQAVTVVSTQAKVTVPNPADSIGLWPVVITNGGTPVPTPMPGGDQVVLNGISGAAATQYYDKLTTSAANSATALQAIQAATTTTAYTGYTIVGASTFLSVSYGAASFVNASHVAGTATGPFYAGMSSTDTAGTFWLYAGTATSLTPVTDAYYYPYAGGTLKVYELPLSPGMGIWHKMAIGTAPRNGTINIYKRQ